MSNEDVPKLLPAAAMGRRLGVDPKWLFEEVNAGRLPGVVAGKTALFDPEVVERLLAERARRVATASVESPEDRGGAP